MDWFLTRRPAGIGLYRLHQCLRQSLAAAWLACLVATAVSAAEPTYRQIFTAYSDGRQAEALSLIEQLSIVPPATDEQLKATYLAIEIAAQKGDARETLAWCDHWLEMCGDRTSGKHPLESYVRFRRALAQGSQGDVDGAAAEYLTLYRELPASPLRGTVALELAWSRFSADGQTTAANQDVDVRSLATEAKELAASGSVNALSASLLLAALNLQDNPRQAEQDFQEILAHDSEDKPAAQVRAKAALLMLEAANAGKLQADRQQLYEILKDTERLPAALRSRTALARGQAAAAMGLHKDSVAELLPLTKTIGTQSDIAPSSDSEASTVTISIAAAVTLLRLPLDASEELSASQRYRIAEALAQELADVQDAENLSADLAAIYQEILIRGAFAARDTGEAKTAIDWLKQALDESTASEPMTGGDLYRDALRTQGEMLAASGAFESAEGYFRRYLLAATATDDQYQTAIASFRLAENSAALNRWRDAREQLEQFAALGSLARQAISPAAVCCLEGRIAIAAAAFPDAVLHLSAAIDQVLRAGVNATAAERQIACRAAWLLGETYLLQRQFDLAIDAYSRVSTIDPESPWCVVAAIQTGKSLESLGRHRAAADIYSDLLANQPDSPYAASARARLDQLSRHAAKPPAGGGSDGLSR